MCGEIRVLCYLNAGASANNAAAIGGGFTFNVNNAPSNANWNHGCGLSLSLRKISALPNAAYNPQHLLKISR